MSTIYNYYINFGIYITLTLHGIKSVNISNFGILSRLVFFSFLIKVLKLYSLVFIEKLLPKTTYLGKGVVYGKMTLTLITPYNKSNDKGEGTNFS